VLKNAQVFLRRASGPLVRWCLLPCDPAANGYSPCPKAFSQALHSLAPIFFHGRKAKKANPYNSFQFLSSFQLRLSLGKLSAARSIAFRVLFQASQASGFDSHRPLQTSKRSDPDTWATECTGYIGNTFGPKGFAGGSNTRVSRSYSGLEVFVLYRKRACSERDDGSPRDCELPYRSLLGESPRERRTPVAQLHVRWAAAAIIFLVWLINGAHDHLVGSRTAVDLR
jgi:hypothetical protein